MLESKSMILRDMFNKIELNTLKLNLPLKTADARRTTFSQFLQQQKKM